MGQTKLNCKFLIVGQLSALAFAFFIAANAQTAPNTPMNLRVIPAECRDATLTPTVANFAAVSGTGSISVTAAANCNWNSTANAPWITVTAGASGQSNGTVTYAISANTISSSRTGALTIVGKSCTITQAGSTVPQGPWVKRFGGSGVDNGRKVIVDTAGNIIMAGAFQATVDFGGGPLMSAGGSDMFIAKYTASGTHLWSKKWGSTGGEIVMGIELDGAGDILVAGIFVGTTNLGGGAVTSTGFSTSNQTNDIYLAKYSGQDGRYLWSKTIGGSNDDTASTLAVDGSGNAILTGFFRGGVDFGGGTLYGTFNGQDAYLAKYDASGAHLWSKGFWGDSGEEGTGLAIDGSGNIFYTGKFQGSTNLKGATTAEFTTKGASDFYLAKFSSAGNHLWSRSFGGGFPDGSTGVALSPAGELWLLGYFSQSIDLGGGGTLKTASSDYDVFLAKYASADGDYLWANSFPGSGYEWPNALSIDTAGNVFITGFFQYTLNLGGTSLTSAQAGSSDIFLAKYQPSGAHSWSERHGGTEGDSGVAIAATPTGHVMVIGSFSGTAPINGQELRSAGSSDIFLLRHAP